MKKIAVILPTTRSNMAPVVVIEKSFRIILHSSMNLLNEIPLCGAKRLMWRLFRHGE
jgi:hypothetical protein